MTADTTATTPAPPVAAVFLFFLRLGVTAFGGPAMVAYMRERAVDRRRWLSGPSFHTGVAICQSIPGATAMQMAAYIGLRARGTAGALAAFAGFVIPPFLLVTLGSILYRQGHDLAAVRSLFTGLQAVVVALTANAAWSFGRGAVRSARDALLATAAALVLVAFPTRVHPMWAIAGCALVAIPLYRGVALPLTVTDPGVPRTPRRAATAPVLALLAAFALFLVALLLLDRTLFDIAALMARIDLLALGGGYASLPLMQHEVVQLRGWIDTRTFMDGIALGQITPGPIVITATFVGYCRAGLPGALVATIAIFTPSVILLLFVVPRFDRLQRFSTFRRILRGALASFVGLLVAVTIRFALAADWTPVTALLALAAFSALRRGVDILWVVAAAAILSLVCL